MRISFVLVLGVMGCIGQAQDILYPEPLDFQDEAFQETYAQSVLQLESGGTSIFIRTENAHLLEIDRHGQVLGVFHLPEEGPKHALRIKTFALHGDRLAMVNQSRQVYLLEKQKVVSSFQTAEFEFEDFYPIANGMGFGFDGRQLVLPSQQNGKLAVVLDASGKVQKRAGEAVAFAEDLKWDTSYFNATFWVKQGGFWYCLFKFARVLRIYDNAFKLVKEVELTSDEIFQSDSELYEPESEHRKKVRVPIPHFSDFKVKGKFAYALCRGALLVIDLENGEVAHRYHFHGKGADFSGVPQGQRLNMMEVAVLDDGHAVLAHPALLWNHDLWLVKL